MSFDTVDELHSAEDQAIRFGAVLQRVALFAEQHPWTGLGDAYNYDGHERLLADLRSAASDAATFCRCFCEANQCSCDDPDCDEHDDHDDTCGCPCHHRTDPAT